MSELGSTSERPGTAAALRRQNDALRQAIAVVDRLTTIALEGVDVDGITAELTAAIHGDVAVFDQLLRPLASSASTGEGGDSSGQPSGTWSIADKRFAGVLETARDRRLPLRIRAVPEWGLHGDVVIAPIAVGEQVLGYLVVTTRGTDGGEEDLELLTVQHAASIYALALVEAQRCAADIEQSSPRACCSGRSIQLAPASSHASPGSGSVSDRCSSPSRRRLASPPHARVLKPAMGSLCCSRSHSTLTRSRRASSHSRDSIT